jgi:hypothetical protein
MGQPDSSALPVVTAEDIRRIESGETINVAGYPLTGDLVAAMSVHPYDYEADGRLKDLAVPVVAENLTRLVLRRRQSRPLE